MCDNANHKVDGATSIHLPKSAKLIAVSTLGKRLWQQNDSVGENEEEKEGGW